MDTQTAFLKLIVGRLEAAGIDYMLTGSLAMAAYAAPRMTRDIDLVVDLDAAAVDRLVELFSDDCVIDDAAVRDAVARRGMVNIIHATWVVKADFIVRKDSEYRRLELSRRRYLDVGGMRVAVVSAEDLLLSKLVWARDSGSELQYGDAAALMRSGEAGVGERLDRDYLQRWAEVLGVSRQLADLLRDRGDEER